MIYGGLFDDMLVKYNCQAKVLLKPAVRLILYQWCQKVMLFLNIYSSKF